MHKILIIDDDRDVLAVNAKSLSEKGYGVYTAETAAQGLELLKGCAPDCILLDVMMPGMDGFEACRKIREISGVPVIFLTGRVSEDDKVNGLLLGADDYMEKPYSLKELEARIVVNLRRGGETHDRLQFPPLEIDLTRKRAFFGGKDLNLSGQEYDLLYLLASHAGEILTFEQIGMRIWDSYREDDRRTLMVAVSRLRKKLEAFPAAARMVETVWSRGYRFLGQQGGASDGR